MTNYKKYILLFIFSAVSHPHLQAGNIVSQGSLDGTTTPTIVDKWVPAIKGQIAQGFVQIRDGIFLSSTITNSIDINNRLDGVISLGNGGTLALIRDLTFGGTSIAVSSGIITTTNNGQKLILTQNQIIPVGVSLTTSGNLIITSNKNSIDLDTSATLRIRTGNKLTLQNTSLLNIAGTKLVMEHSTSKLALDSSDLLLSGNYTFSQGSMSIQGACSIKTTSSIDTLFSFSGHYLFIAKNSSLTIGPGVTFQYNPGSGIREGICLEDMSSQLILNNATLRNNNLIGMILHNGNLVIQGTSIVEGTSTDTKQALILGGSADFWGDCRLLIDPDAKLSIKRSGIAYRNKGTYGFSSTGNNACLHIEEDGSFTIEEPLTLPESLTITSTSPSALSFVGTTSINLNSKRLNLGLIQIDTNTGVNGITANGTSATISFSNQNGNQPEYTQFSHNGRYLAIGIGNTNVVSFPRSKLQVYSLLDTGSFASIRSRLAQDAPNSTTGPTGDEVYGIGFSPDGKYLAATVNIRVQVYAFDTNNGPSSQDLTAISSAVVTNGIGISSVWSPDGRFLAVTETAQSSLIVFSWDGAQLTRIATASISSEGRTVAWSKSGKYLLVSNRPAGVLLFQFDEKQLTPVTSRSVAGATVALDLDLSPDGHYVLIAHDQSSAGTTSSIFSFFNGDLSTTATTGTGIETNGGFSSKWSPEGKNFVVGYGAGAKVMSYNGTSATQLVAISEPTQVSGLDWHPTGSYLALTHYSDAAATGELETRSLPYSSLTQEIRLTNGTMTINQPTILNGINLRAA
jgi:6-phosphogluconolactonase (cycloisomerase 2 family)